MNPTDPSIISSLSPYLWLDPSDTSTLFNAVTGGSLPSVGSGVARIEDKGSGGNNFTQSSATARPNRQEFNGKSILRFDGSNDRMTKTNSNLFRNINGGMIFVVRKYNSFPSSAMTPFAISNNSTGARASVNAGVVSGKSNIGGRRLDANSYQQINSVEDVGVGVFEIAVGEFDYANSDLRMYFNKTFQNENLSFQTDGFTSNTASATSAIGSAAVAAQFLDGDIAEILVFHTILTDLQKDQVLNYLGFKWSIFKLDII